MLHYYRTNARNIECWYYYTTIHLPAFTAKDFTFCSDGLTVTMIVSSCSSEKVILVIIVIMESSGGLVPDSWE